MRHWMMVFACVAVVACGSEDDENGGNGGGGGDGCDGCTDGELCVIEFGDSTEERCEAIPDICGETGDCFDTECQSAMYDYCPEETSAWACSDTFPPTYISCTL